MRRRIARQISTAAFLIAAFASTAGEATDLDDRVGVKSGDSTSETIARLKKHIADKGLSRFDEIDQS